MIKWYISDTIVVSGDHMAFTLRLDEEQQRKLDELSKSAHTSNAAIVKQAIDQKYENDKVNARPQTPYVAPQPVSTGEDPYWASLSPERQQAYAGTIAATSGTLSYLRDH